MCKTIFVLNIGNYLPDLCKITLPSIKAYAERIGAEFRLITERKYPKWPITYEKLQIFELGRDSDWNFYIDADTVISPMLHDVTNVVPKNHVGVFMGYPATLLFPSDRYFLRDGRNMGLATHFILTSGLCHDLWTPFDEDVESVLARLRQSSIAKPHHVDEYCLSRNLARFGLKYGGVVDDTLEHLLHLSSTCEKDDDAVERATAFVEKWKNIQAMPSTAAATTSLGSGRYPEKSDGASTM